MGGEWLLLFAWEGWAGAAAAAGGALVANIALPSWASRAALV